MKTLCGFTLIEMRVSTLILVMAIAAVSMIVVASGRVMSNAESTGDSNQASRHAGEAVANWARSAGLGSGNQMMTNVNGTAQVIYPIFGFDNTGTNNSDELWMVVPFKNATPEKCTIGGLLTWCVIRGSPTYLAMAAPAGAGSFSAAYVGAGPPQTLQVNDLFLATNMNVGSALFQIQSLALNSPPVPSVLNVYNPVANITDNPPVSGFTAGELVYPVRVLHFFVGTNANDLRIPVHTHLFMEDGQLSFTDPTNPFKPAVPPPGAQGTKILIQEDIEDFQVAYGFDSAAGTGNPDGYQFLDAPAVSLFLQTSSKNNLRALRISIVAKTSKPLRTTDEGTSTNGIGLIGGTVPMTVENHVPGATAGRGDGYGRTLYFLRA